MFIYNPDLKLAYYGKGKTGTTTIHKHFDLFDDGFKETSSEGWISLTEGAEIHNPFQKQFRDYKITCLAREPFDRWLSGIIEIIALNSGLISNVSRVDLFKSKDKVLKIFESLLNLTFQGKDFSMNQDFHTGFFMWEIYLILFNRKSDILLTENIDKHFETVWNKPAVKINSSNESKTIILDIIQNHSWFEEVNNFLEFDTSLFNLLMDHTKMNANYTLDADTEFLRNHSELENLFYENSTNPTINFAMYDAFFKIMISDKNS